MFTSKVAALRKLADTWTFERYPVVSALVAELYDSSNVEIDRQISSLGAAQCRWFKEGLRKSEQGLATAHVVPLFAAKGGRTWHLIQRLDNMYLR